MKVVLLCPELFAAEGGVARALRVYLNALGEDPRYNLVSVISLNDTAFPTERLRAYHPNPQACALRVHACRRSRIRFASRALRETRGAARVICGHANLLPVARLAQLRNRSLEAYLVAHGIEVWRRFSLLQRWALRGVTRVWCVSAFTRETMLAHAPCLDSERCITLPNALDPAFSPDPLSARVQESPIPPTILTVARLDRRDAYKGIDLLIRAFPRVLAAQPDVRLRIVGKGDDQARLARLAQTHGVESRVDFTGEISDAELRGEYAGCRLVALPSSREGFGLVFIEAFAFGKPVVGVAAGAAPEVIDGDSGILAPPNDPDALADAVIETMRRPWDADRIRSRARHFSYAAFRERLERAYL